jgi:hypothetical protein
MEVRIPVKNFECRGESFLHMTDSHRAIHCAQAVVVMVRGGFAKLVVEEEKLLCALEKS